MRRFRCETIQQQPGGVHRTVASVGDWLGGLMLVGMAASWERGVGLSAVVATAVMFAPQALLSLRSLRVKGGYLEVSAGTIQVSDPEVCVRMEQVIGAYAKDPRSLVVQLFDGTQITAQLVKDAPEQVLRAFGFDASRRALVAPLRGHVGALTAGFATFVAVMLGASVLLAWTLGEAGLLAALVLAIAASAWVGRRAGSRRVVVGADGVRVVGVWGSRFVPRALIAGVEEVQEELVRGEPPQTLGLELRLRTGERLMLDMLTLEKAQRDAVQAMIEKGPLASSETSEAQAALGRGEQSIAAWRKSLTDRYGSTARYRQSALSEDDLVASLDDSAAAPGVRIGAALALRVLRPDEVRRIRVAASTSADDDLRAALEAVCDGTLDEAKVRRAERRG